MTSKVSEEKRDLQKRIIELSEANPRYGYRRIWALLRRENAVVNSKRIQRVRREAELQVRKKQRRKRRLGPTETQRRVAKRPGEVWSWDFVSDQTANGSRFRILTLIDEYTRQCLALHAG
jgi:putative transposase